MGETERRRDRQLVERFRSGDREAFAELYHAHYPALFRHALYMTGDRVRAGETVQDVFVWLIHHSKDFDESRGDLGPFLGGVARKLLLRRQRTESRWLPFDEAAASVRDANDDDQFARGLERDEETAQLRKAIAALPERYRDAVVHCDLEGRRQRPEVGRDTKTATGSAATGGLIHFGASMRCPHIGLNVPAQVQSQNSPRHPKTIQQRGFAACPRTRELVFGSTVL